MHQKQSRQTKVKRLERIKIMSSIKGASHLSSRAKRRLYCKVQFFMWRKQQQKSRFGVFHSGKRNNCNPCLSLRIRLQKTKTEMDQTANDGNIQTETTSSTSPVGCNTGCSQDTFRKQTFLSTLPESDCLSQAVNGSCHFQDWAADRRIATANVSQTTPPTADPSQNTETSLQVTITPDPLKLCCDAVSSQSRNGSAHGESDVMSNPGRAHKIDVDRRSQSRTSAIQGHNQPAEQDTERCDDVSLKTLVKDIHDFLSDFYRTYGSFIPLQKSDVLQHLRSRFNTEFADRQAQIFSEVLRYRGMIALKPASSFRVVYKKHVLNLDDLLTLADQNWLNDQVMNMYGELIMDFSRHKVHFLNSFFHRQLMTKGYNGVKRWTKKVDLFSKSLLLVPIHLEVHWCLVTADITKKKVCLYDSQGNALHKVARNILRYLITEAKEKKQTAFENGWTVSFDEKVPQQTNENDCGVFVLEYSRYLALTRPLQFSQNDIPKIRKRIYRELCEHELLELG